MKNTNCLLFLASSVSAGFSQIKFLLEKIETVQNNTGFRSLDSTLGSLDQNYGCWCYMDDFHGLGRGQPVDKVDEECRVLHNNYECLILETSTASPDSCDENPWNVGYNLEASTELLFSVIQRNEEKVINFCKEFNPNDICAQNVCIVEIRGIPPRWNTKRWNRNYTAVGWKIKGFLMIGVELLFGDTP